jgi:hypothetical protein
MKDGEIGYEPARATVRYQVEGTVDTGGVLDPFDFIAAYSMVPGVIPRTFAHPTGTLFLQDIQIHENHAGRIYSISAPYGVAQKEPGAYQIAVDQTGGTVNVTAGTRIAGYTRSGEESKEKDNHGLIGVDGDEIRGVDIPVAESKIVINFRHPEGILDAAYVKAIGRLVGYPNSVPFLTYDPGEVLYLGSNFVQTNTEATAQYSFAISYNVTDLVIGEITVDFKAGWDVLNITYEDKKEPGDLSKQIRSIEVIRPAGRGWVDYVAAFGWGS